MKTLYDIQRTNQIRQQVQQNQQREALAKAFAANSHSMFVMNETEFFELAVNIKPLCVNLMLNQLILR